MSFENHRDLKPGEYVNMGMTVPQEAILPQSDGSAISLRHALRGRIYVKLGEVFSGGHFSYQLSVPLPEVRGLKY